MISKISTSRASGAKAGAGSAFVTGGGSTGSGLFTGVNTVLLGQLEAQDGSPPPPTLAEFAIVLPAAAGSGITGTV